MKDEAKEYFVFFDDNDLKTKFVDEFCALGMWHMRMPFKGKTIDGQNFVYALTNVSIMETLKTKFPAIKVVEAKDFEPTYGDDF